MKKTLFCAFVALQALVPVAIAGLREADVAFGRHVLLEVEPLDPRDPFRGQYVALRYPIADVATGAEEGAVVYMRLYRTGGGVWSGIYEGTGEPGGGTYIRGRVHGGRMQFGIEQFYTSEEDARRYEAALAVHRVYADVALGRGGRATLTRLVIRDS